MKKMRVAPISFKEACEYIDSVHRHYKAPHGHKFSLSLIDEEDNIHGVLMCGRPVNRNLDDYDTLEITRLATDGTKNACSLLYNACKRAAFNMGYLKVVTYILESELGTSLIASGWKKVCDTRYKSWDHAERKRNETNLQCSKQRYEVENKINWKIL